MCFPGVEKHITVLKWFQEDENKIKQFFWIPIIYN